MTRLLTLLCCVMLLLPAIAGAKARDGHPSRMTSGDFFPGVVIIKFKAGIGPASGSLSKAGGGLASTLARQGVKSLARTFPEVRPPDATSAAGSRVDLSRIYYGAVNAGADVRAIAQRLSTLPQVEYAEPKFVQHVQEAPNDTLFATRQAVYFGRLNAVAGWSIAKGSPTVAIAAVDGGTYWQHEDLIGNLWINPAEDINHNGRFDPGPPPAGDEDGIDEDADGKVDDVIGWNFSNNSNNPRGLPNTPGMRAHGTATASHFGAVTNNVTGMAGSSWNCRLMPVCASSTTTDDVIEFGYEGIQYASGRGAQIINCSWGRVGPASQFERDVIVAATQAGSLIVAAAGNDTTNVDLFPEYPAGYPEVASIGATNTTSDGLAFFSNYGVNVLAFAPGTNIWSARDGGGYINGGSGTSYSSPLVAGLAGILKSVHPDWTSWQIMAQIRTTADSIDAVNALRAGEVGRGRVNFGRALTESHAGIQILDASIATPSGRNYFIPGDTMVVTLTVKNVLPREAVNLQFTATSSDPAFQPVLSPVTVASLVQNAQVVLPPLTLRIGTVSSNRLSSLTVNWVSNGNERDAYAYRVYLFTSMLRWLPQSSPATISLRSVRAASPTVVWASGGNDSATSPAVLRTVDAGQHWTRVTGLLSGADFYTIFAVDELHAWVGSGDGRIFATIDGGLTWRQQPYPNPQSPFIDGIWFFDANNGFALGDPDAASSKYVLLRTTNGGATWSHLPGEPVAATGETGWNNSFWWSDPQHGWFGTNQFKIRATSDGGATWYAGQTNSQNSIGVSFKDLLNGVAAFDDGKAELTTDGGRSWASGNTPARAATLTSVAFAPRTDQVWTSDGLLPYHSRDAGKTWAAEATYPVTGFINHLSFADSVHGWAVTSFGEILRYAADTSHITPPPTNSAALVLEQNYPNPFSLTTSIRFSIQAPSHVTITVYDILGRKVRVAYEADQAAGTWSVPFSGEGLASGVYMYRIKTVDNEATRKMLVIH